jgi:hypothetical protein
VTGVHLTETGFAVSVKHTLAGSTQRGHADKSFKIALLAALGFHQTAMAHRHSQWLNPIKKNTDESLS